MKIQVLQKDIDKANAKNSSPKFDSLKDCIVGQALKRIFKTADIEVGFLTARVKNKFYRLSNNASDRIRFWMETEAADPFEFEMREIAL